MSKRWTITAPEIAEQARRREHLERSRHSRLNLSLSIPGEEPGLGAA
jgi:hypothetical protein